MYWPTLKIILYMEKECSFHDVFNSNFETNPGQTGYMGHCVELVQS